jgi:DNA-directed RNA polymerase specialized sigma24 family protein
MSRPASSGCRFGEPAPAPNADAFYASAIAEFGPALARLAAACERDGSLQQDLLQDIHVAVWRSFATFRNQCSLRTWVYRVAHNTAASFARRHRKFRRAPLPRGHGRASMFPCLSCCVASSQLFSPPARQIYPLDSVRAAFRARLQRAKEVPHYW